MNGYVKDFSFIAFLAGGKKQAELLGRLSVKDGCRESWCSNDWPTLEIIPGIIYNIISPISSHLALSQIEAALKLCCRDSAKICRDLYLSLKVKLYFIPRHQRWVTWEKVKRKKGRFAASSCITQKFPSILLILEQHTFITDRIFVLVADYIV